MCRHSCVTSGMGRVQKHGEVGGFCLHRVREQEVYACVMWVLDCFCCGDVSHWEKKLHVATGRQVILYYACQVGFKKAEVFIYFLVWDSCCCREVSSSRADFMLPRNELWGKNFLGLIVCLSSRRFSSVWRASVDNPGSKEQIKVTVYSCDLCLGFKTKYCPAVCPSLECSSCSKFEIFVFKNPNKALLSKFGLQTRELDCVHLFRASQHWLQDFLALILFWKHASRKILSLTFLVSSHPNTW